MLVLDETIVVEKVFYTMDNFKDVMIDLETLGRGPGCIVLSIGAVAFNPETKELGPKFYQVFNIKNQLDYDLTKDTETVQWWESQTDEAREVLEQAEIGGEFLRDGLLKFEGWLSQFDSRTLRIWGNGADFDNAILQYLYSKLYMKPRWKFWNNRCFRTLTHVLVGTPYRPGRKELQHRPEREGTYHNALDDAVFQAKWAIELLHEESNG